MAEPTLQATTKPARTEEAGLTAAEQGELRARAVETARSCGWLTGRSRSRRARALLHRVSGRLSELEDELHQCEGSEPSADLRWLQDNLRMIRADLRDIESAAKSFAKLPLVRTPHEEAIARCIVLARSFAAASPRLTEPAFSFFTDAVQQVEPLRLSELDGMLAALKLAYLEVLAEHGFQAVEAFRSQGKTAPSFDIGIVITSLRFITEIDWKETLEQLSVIHRSLLRDPCGIYPRMEFESRAAYRKRAAKIAAHSDCNERQVADLAVRLAQEAPIEPAKPQPLRERLRHVGYYLIDETGSRELLRHCSYRTPIGTRLQRLLRTYPDEIYIIGIEFIALITVVLLIMSVVKHQEGAGIVIGALLLILPATQAAVEVMNYLVTSILTPHALPKLDFSKGIDSDCATIVAIPTLLINAKQIRQLVDDLEIRYLANRDPNIFFALLTDLPDTAEPVGEQDTRIDLAVSLIEGLNSKYGNEPYGGFYLFHRHRVYNPREGAWMGWERKRGKLLDLNQFLRTTFDPFPVKAGDVPLLPPIRYVLTLDSDTQLPRGTAQRMIGAMAHPLNRPLIDPDLNIVVDGYGLLQPRVGISVASASSSHLAAIYSGQTGFDIYSRAISDVYQDLYEEGIFTGKGIYDIDAFRQVLEHRFPRNTLLSHDLIEGAYVRAGLASDIEVIDDYPSRYSAYNRRKHRWLRGDWQIVRWIFNRVPDETRRLVRNPISLISRWKIFDNLRRSLVEPATFALLIAGWFGLPGGPRFWTIVTLALLFLPIYFRLVFTLLRALFKRNAQTARDALVDFLTSHVNILLNIAFLAHQALVALDAIIRTVIRSTVTHNRLLEWETATEAELGIRKRTPVDVYLQWMPLLAIILAGGLALHPVAAPYASPFVAAWFFSKLISNWLNRSPHPEDYNLSGEDRVFLRDLALHTWRYFAEFSSEKNNWLVPDNVQEQPYVVAERISPTNLGFLLNARQAALEFGYLTVSEFVAQTEATLQSMAKLPRHFGHFLNWYETVSLKPLEPHFVSSVDSGNLAASLWALKQGCIDLLSRPLLRQNALEGIEDYYRLAGKPAKEAAGIFRLTDPSVWLARLLDLPIDRKANWWAAELGRRIDALHREIRDYLPFYLPEFDRLRAAGLEQPSYSLTLENTPRFFADANRRLGLVLAKPDLPEDVAELGMRLRQMLADARDRVLHLAVRLGSQAAESDRFVREMSFKLLLNRQRKLLSVGLDASDGQLNKSCYDLLASEARTAAFIAVAKNDIEPETWFRIGRQHTVTEGETVLISWTGTMFEYLMPVIWMKSQPSTLLDRAVGSSVRVQQSYAKHRRVPWGISEAAFSARDPQGNYQYAAFGIPGLALNVARSGMLVISPYSSCLALAVNPSGAVENLRTMASRKWLSDYGFYESADFTASAPRRFGRRKCELVRCWMAHHQGMSLTAICNLLHRSAFQRWFHAEPLVQANELILQERPLRVRATSSPQPRRLVRLSPKRKLKAESPA
ncbi:MAG: glucoamylase family protein [Bryobacteraceae bacterium]